MAQMTIVDRNSIEDGLRRGLSIPEIAKLVSRPPQTVTNEIKNQWGLTPLQTPWGQTPLQAN